MKRSLASVTLAGLIHTAAGAPPAAQQAFVNWETPHVHPLTTTPNRALLLAVNLPDNRLEVFSITGGSPVHLGSIPVGLDPVSVRARSDTQVWVVNHLSDTVSVIDLVSGQVVATLATDDEPCDVVFAGTPTRAFVTCSQANTVLVFDPANRGQPPLRISLDGEDPRALALSPAGDKVYAAIFESGNRTTILSSGGVAMNDFPPDVVGLASGPHGGQNPPPNAGSEFDPPLAPELPAPPRVGLIIRQDAAGRWVDDNAGDWTAFVSGTFAPYTGRVVGWQIGDHDVAVIDAATLSVSYLDRLMNLCMALAVNPASGKVAVVGTDATNEVRFEPNLAGRFLRVELGLVDPAEPTEPSVVDLNTHLVYDVATVPQAERDKTLSDPRGIVWNAAGTRAYVTGMGTNNVVVLDANGARAGLAPTIAVGQGPTGLVLDEPRQRLYVLNKFEASISVVDTGTELELTRVAFFDPTPPVIRAGRKHLYDARATSGLGLTACASCHVDARIDRLAWDLGNPGGAMQGLEGLNLKAGIPDGTGGISAIHSDFADFHPMKGPLLTQTLQDIIGHEPFHWRGDKRGLEEFNPAFQSLQGDDEMLSASEMQEFEDFLATIHFPPNPFRTLENALPTDLPLTGHYTTGSFEPAGQPLPNGNAVNGRVLFEETLLCHFCHTLPNGLGANATWNGTSFEPIPAGPMGEAHHPILPPIFNRTENFKIPSLRNVYERVGFEGTIPSSKAGFGMRHDGAIDSLARFVSRPIIEVTSDQDVADLVAFLLSINGDSEPEGPSDDLAHPPGSRSQSTHAAVGRQATFNGTADATAAALLTLLLAEADQGDVAVIARGRIGALDRGFYYLGNGRFQSDRSTERYTVGALLTIANASTPMTFTAVPRGSERRIGADRDADGALDRDELDHGFDPADPASRPGPRSGSKRGVSRVNNTDASQFNTDASQFRISIDAWPPARSPSPGERSDGLLVSARRMPGAFPLETQPGFRTRRRAA
jgi:YVTN family beta-propeller protein